MDRVVYVVPHTHWDREWYQPFELFRWRLVQMIDELIDHMERHPEYRCFNLDGQSIVIADYLELRPENQRRLRRLIEQGRIIIGPWWVQPDEFLPSGESHIRSFQKGIRFARELGGCLDVGHCADQFGHIAQMPQIMAGFGLTSACLWRGVPDSVPGWSFQWEAPDGTALPTLYLRNSYSSGWRLPNDAAALIDRTRRQEPGHRENEPLLLMNGTDHSRMEKHVPALLQQAQGRGYDFRLATLGEYAQAMAESGFSAHVHRGELRSTDNSNVLAGVLSTRMKIKQRDFAVGSYLERVAEPLELLSWLHGGPDGLPALKHAWNLMLENSPHDSICGCSIDQVHREMFPRYDRAEQLAKQVARESVAYLARKSAVPEGGAIAVFRPVPHAPAVVEVQVPNRWKATSLRLPDGRVIPVDLGERTADKVLQKDDTTPRGILRHLDFLREGRYDALAVEDFRWSIKRKKLEFVTTVGDGVNVVDQDLVREEIEQAADAALAERAEVRVEHEGRRTMRFVLPPSGTVGLEVLTPVVAAASQLPSDISVTKYSIANSIYRIEWTKTGIRVIDQRIGLEIENAIRLVVEQDDGDEYNAEISGREISPIPEPLGNCIGGTTWAQMLVVYTVRKAIRISKKDPYARRSAPAVESYMSLTLWSGVPRVDIRIIDSPHLPDHRMRAVFALPFEVTEAITENQFHVANRSLQVPKWNGKSAEQPPATFPQKTFAAFEAGNRGLAVFNKGLPEGEVITDKKGKQLYALTLARAVGWLSRNDLKSRRGGAGPMIETPEAQMPGLHTFEFALTTYRGNWRDAGVQPLAHAYAYPPVAFATNEHEGDNLSSYSLARIDDPRIVPSAFHRSHLDGAPIARVYSSADELVQSNIFVPAGSEGAGTTNLLEEHRDTLEYEAGGWPLRLRPWQIQTMRFGRRG